MDNLFLRVLRQWLPLAVVTSAFCFILAIVAQQEIRISANDPQIQLAEDMANVLNNGKTQALPDTIDISKSLAPFVIVYNLQGDVVSSSARLNNQAPSLPIGALHSSKGTEQSGENRITWQPQDGVRLASVIVHFNRGYAVSYTHLTLPTIYSV